MLPMDAWKPMHAHGELEAHGHGGCGEKRVLWCSYQSTSAVTRLSRVSRSRSRTRTPVQSTECRYLLVFER